MFSSSSGCEVVLIEFSRVVENVIDLAVEAAEALTSVRARKADGGGLYLQSTVSIYQNRAKQCV